MQKQLDELKALLLKKDNQQMLNTYFKGILSKINIAFIIKLFKA